jgi:hypothetical protein
MKRREQILHRLDTHERTMLWNSFAYAIKQQLRYSLMDKMTNHGYAWQFKVFSLLRAAIQNEAA